MKNRLVPLVLAVLVVLPVPSRDEDLWSAALTKARGIADVLEDGYYEPLETEDLAVAAIKGTLDTLDPHSYFLDPSSFSRMREDYTGKYFGVGMQIQKQGDAIVVIAPIEGGPAWRLGVLPGDVISRIDGESTVPISSYDAMQKLRGEKGTEVTVTMVRDGTDKPFDLTITREEIPLLSVPYVFLFDGGVGYIYIRNFGEETPRELEDALAKLAGQGMKSLVLDLRLNTGGALASSIEVSDLFLPRGSLIVSMDGRNPRYDQKFSAYADGQYEDLPLVILIDQGTASASEIVSGAVMDHDRGLVVGEDSWGKGLVQTVFPLAPDMAVALTVAKYLTPSGRSIQRDYSHLDDYLTSKRAPEDSRMIHYTARGRKVLGQGGITPDYAVDSLLKPLTGRLRIRGEFFGYARKFVQHQTELGRKFVFPSDPPGGRAAAAGKIQVGASFVVTDEVVADFRRYLGTRQVEYDEAAFGAAEPEIRRELEREIAGAIWGVEAGMKVSRENDPVVLKAIEVMPEAARFLERR
ncbi:MAG TPA: S41 family peptidase [Candidatus Aminicenantes bacterium]|nr:S41 family peptidase [Candidatus Aminicenantes bacterium]